MSLGRRVTGGGAGLVGAPSEVAVAGRSRLVAGEQVAVLGCTPGWRS